MDELLKMIEGLNLSEEERAHWEYVIAKFLEYHMPPSKMNKEDLRFLKENGWYPFFRRLYFEKKSD